MSIQRRLARFNRAFGNRVVGRIIPRMPGFGTVHHRGRKSGREYRTPVKVFRWDDRYVVSLPYGADSDWVRNVVTAGGCDLTTGGRRLRMVDPMIYKDEGQAAIPAFIRGTLKRVKATEFLALSHAQADAKQT